MSTQSYLSYGIVHGRAHAAQDPALLRTVELDRERARRARRTANGRRRFRR